MPHLDPEATTRWCAGIPHPQLQIFAYRCTHDGSTVAYFTTGHCEDPVEVGPLVFGPFDDYTSVLSDLVENLASLLLPLFEP